MPSIQELPEIHVRGWTRKGETAIAMPAQDPHEENTSPIVRDTMILGIQNLPMDSVGVQTHKAVHNAFHALPLFRGTQALHILQEKCFGPCQPDCLQNFEENLPTDAIETLPQASPGEWLTRKANNIQVGLLHALVGAIVDASVKLIRIAMPAQHASTRLLAIRSPDVSPWQTHPLQH